MKITEEMIDKMFDSYFKYGRNSNGETPSQIEIFKAAFDILLPIIEIQNNALKFYAHVNNPEDLGSWDMRKKFIFDIIQADDCDQAHYDIDKYMFGGKRARSTLAFVEQEIKKMVEANK